LIRRRLFLVVLGLHLGSAISEAFAQRPDKLPVIGLVSFAASSDDPAYEALRQRLRELGHVEGRSIVIEFRNAQGDTTRLPAIAEELVARSVDVIVVGNPVAARAMMSATSTIPIVITASDPLSSGLITNLARPGGNVTGLSTMTTELHEKRLELLKDAVPGLKRVAVLWHPFSPRVQKAVEDLKATAPALSVELMPIQAGSPADFDNAFAAASRAHIQAVYILESPLFYAHRRRLAQVALNARLPTIYGTRYFVDDGGLMSYGADFTEQARRIADYVDKLLKGAKPGDLPIEQTTQIQFAINLKTARAIGLTVPPSVLTRADYVVR
jgi:putative ABC transport system substrate-binding protein